MILKYTLVVLSLLVGAVAHAQFSTGTWRDHLPYGRTVDVCHDDKNMIYCATPYALFKYDQFSGEIERISKVNYLSDVGISSVEFDPVTGLVIVGYENGNLDFYAGGQSFNLADIKFSNLIGDKGIYDILPQDGFAYLSTGFGVVVIDLNKLEVKSTYIIGDGGSQQRVYDIEIIGDTIYAAMDAGVKKAGLNNPFLSNFQNWTLDTSFPEGIITDLEFFVGQMYACVNGETNDVIWRTNSNGTWEVFAEYEGLFFNRLWCDGEWLTLSGNGVYQVFHDDLNMNYNMVDHAGVYVNANMAVMDELGSVWVADNSAGLLWKKGTTIESIVRPAGPAQASARRLAAWNDNLWVAHGGFNDFWGNFWNKAPLSGFVDEEWRIIPFNSGTNGTDGVNDILDAAIDPLNPSHVFFGSWEEGLIELKPNGSITTFNVETNNSPLQSPGYDWAIGWTGVAGVDYSIDGILWMTNSMSEDQIHARDRSGTFYSFGFSPQVDEEDKVGDIIASQLGYVWAIVRNKGLLVLNTNGTLGSTSDDNYKLLTDEEGKGGLPNKDVFCIQEDLDGEVWVGTLQGLAVFYNQDAIFTEENFDAEQILITQDGNVQILLETEAITAIEIDGGNRKWVGTQNSGVFLFSDDGLQEIYHFTENNSPLLSNTIFDIAINQENGEVFFATDKGIVSFFSTATNFDPEMGNVRIYPNPVRPEYDGNITVDGLAYDSIVKVTDLQGNLVYETTSEGGRAVWNGRTQSGERPATGVYLVFSANQDGTVDNVGKITFIR